MKEEVREETTKGTEKVNIAKENKRMREWN
jgi:hypothetical protein